MIFTHYFEAQRISFCKAEFLSKAIWHFDVDRARVSAIDVRGHLYSFAPNAALGLYVGKYTITIDQSYISSPLSRRSTSIGSFAP